MTLICEQARRCSDGEIWLNLETQIKTTAPLTHMKMLIEKGFNYIIRPEIPARAWVIFCDHLGL